MAASAPTPMTGFVWRSPALRVESVCVSAGTRLSGHGHDAPHLCHLVEGGFVERDRGRDRIVVKGTVRCSPAGDEHALEFTAPSRCLLVMVEGDAGEIAPRLPTERRFMRGERTGALAERVEAAVSRRDTSLLEVESLVLELLAATSRPTRAADASPRWLDELRDRIREGEAQRCSTTELAVEAGYHPVYVARAFRRRYGLGLGEYARRVRAERALRLLEDPALSLSRVALRAGYSDQSHMTRSLKRMVGATPGRVRSAGPPVRITRIGDGVAGVQYDPADRD